jgi:hypothetical protein
MAGGGAHAVGERGGRGVNVACPLSRDRRPRLPSHASGAVASRAALLMWWVSKRRARIKTKLFQNCAERCRASQRSSLALIGALALPPLHLVERATELPQGRDARDSLPHPPLAMLVSAKPGRRLTRRGGGGWSTWA